MDIFSGKVRLLQKGVTYDLVEVNLFWVTICYGLAGSPTKKTDHVCKIPVERSEIIVRLKQAKGQQLALEVDESDHPLLETTGLDLGQARQWLEQSLCEHKKLEFKGVSDWNEKEAVDYFQCTECGLFIYEDSEIFKGLNPPVRCPHRKITALGPAWKSKGKDYFECVKCKLHQTLNYRGFKNSEMVKKEGEK